MTTRRAALRAGGAALAAALAGCAGSGADEPASPEDAAAADVTSTTTATTTDDATTTTASEVTLRAETVAASAVPSGATVAVATPALLDLVDTAASANERVDLVGSDPASSEQSLALGQFAYVHYEDEAYEASGSFAGFASEASYQYSVREVTESEGELDGEVLSYAALSESERAVADEMVDARTYSVGHHEQKPEAVVPFERHDYLRTETAMYEIRVTVGDHAAHYMLDLDPANPPQDAQVVTVADDPVPERLRETVAAAVAEGAAPVSNRGALASFLDGVDYVVTTTAVAELELSDA